MMHVQLVSRGEAAFDAVLACKHRRRKFSNEPWHDSEQRTGQVVHAPAPLTDFQVPGAHGVQPAPVNPAGLCNTRNKCEWAPSIQ